MDRYRISYINSNKQYEITTQTFKDKRDALIKYAECRLLGQYPVLDVRDGGGVWWTARNTNIWQILRSIDG